MSVFGHAGPGGVRRADTPLRDAFNSPDALGTEPGPEGTSIECCTHSPIH